MASAAIQEPVPLVPPQRGARDALEQPPVAAGLPQLRRIMKISRKRKRSRLALRRLMRPVSVHCGIKSISSSGKTTGRPRVLSDELHAENLTAIVQRRNRSYVQQARNALQKTHEFRTLLARHVQSLCEDVRWLVPEEGPHQQTAPSPTDPCVVEAQKLFSSDALYIELRHRMKVLALKTAECYLQLMRARDYAQKHRVTVAALAAQALQVRQNILSELVEARRMYFKRYEAYESDDEEAADNPVEDVTQTVHAGSRVRRRVKKKRVHSHGEARQDSMEVLSRTAIRRSGGNSLRNNAQCLKIRRRKEANIRTELDRTTDEGRRAQLNRELKEVLASGRLFRCKAARIVRMRNAREALSREQMRRGAFVQDAIDQHNCDATADKAKALHARHSLNPEDQKRVQIEAEKKRRHAEALARIQARHFPERTAPDLHVVSKTCEMLCTAFDQLDCMLGAHANTMHGLADRVSAAVLCLERVQLLGKTGAWQRRLRSLLDKVLKPTLCDPLPLERVMIRDLSSVADRVDTTTEVEKQVQRWYNHGEGGLKTAYCARNNVESHAVARANAPLLGSMYQHTMFRGVHRIANRDDETVPLPSSSFSASNGVGDPRERG